MKWFEQKLPGFRIIYLHDPFSCHKCTDVMRYDSDDTLDKSVTQEKSDELKKFCKEFQWKNISQQRQKKSHVHPESMLQEPYEYSAMKNKAVKKRSARIANSKSFEAVPMNSSKKKSQEPKKTPKKSGRKKTSGKGTTKISPKKKTACSPGNKPSPSKKRRGSSQNKKQRGSSPNKKQRGSSPNKKQRGSSSKENEIDSKVPGKGTLKRKRWFLNKLNHKNDNYEDDLFEDKKFGHFQSLLEDETDNAEKYEELKTPVFPFSISPRERSPSPTYKDCYSPTELSRCRKGAEEYQYRRRRRRKRLSFPDDGTEAPQADPQSREADVQKRLEAVAKILHDQKKTSSDSEDDQYFSDVLDNSSSVNP